MERITSAVALLALSIGSAQAADTDVVIVGHGALSCASLTKDQGDEIATISAGAWLDGYLSGRNIYASDEQQADLPDAAARRLWVTEYCLTHPLDPIYVAADALLRELLVRKADRLVGIR